MTITERGSHGSSQVEHRGKGFDGETTLFDVTPISYAQFGMLPQVHRKERDIYDTIKILLEAAGPKVPPMENIQNRYLMPKS